MTPRARRRRRLVALTALSAGAGASLFAFLSPDGSSPEPVRAADSRASAERAATADPGASLPNPVEPAFTPGKPRLLSNAGHISRWARVRFPTVARVEPSEGSPAVSTLDARTPEGTDNIVVALTAAKDEAGELWVRVRLPVLPNNTTGWVPRRALGGYGVVRTRLVVDLDRLQATLLLEGEPVFTAPIGVGRPESPTPTGEFYVRNRLTHFDDPFYGPIAFGTSARSATLTDWPAGGFVGIHGTNRPDILPGRVSHGCIRLRNEDILRLDRLMPVGTPVTIR